MKALTILQPYAHLIATGKKRVENRSHDRFKKFRGPLLIHAGVSKRMLEASCGLRHDEMAFGAIVAVVDVVDHFRRGAPVKRGHSNWFDPTAIPEATAALYPWLTSHVHVEGPCCLVLGNLRRLETPIPCKGLQGIWNVPADVQALIAEQLQAAEVSHA